MFLKNILIFSSAALLLGAPLAMAQTESVVKDGKPRYVETNLIPEFNSITAGQPLNFAITQKHTPGWHTYWKNPGDSGETTSIEWILPQDFKAGEMIYPAPELQPTGPLVNFGFGHDETLLTSIDVPAKIDGDSVTLTAKISWLVCHDICVPEMKEVSMTLPVTKAGETATANEPEIFTEARAAIPAPKAWQGMLEEQDQNLIVKFKLDEDGKKDLAGASHLFFFPEEWGVILNAEAQESEITQDQLIIKMRRDTRPLSEIQTLNAVLTYVTPEGEKKAVALSIPISTKAAIAAPIGTSTPTTPPEATSFGQALFLALLGGLILNLMPCVFPVLSLKALSLVKMSEREQKHANLHGLLYTAGILVCFGAIAGLLIALQMAGQQIGWGFQLQNPIVILLLAYLLFTMALNLSGFFEIRSGPLANLGHKLASKHGYKGSFFTGMLATIVATPCTAPFMATAMGYALTQPPYVALTVFMALGLGLAMPYLILCFIPALRKSLPKPGAWMETFRQFMSFPLFASVAWLIWVYAQQVDGGYGTLLGLAGLIFIAFGIWVARHEPRKQPWKTGIHAVSVISIIMAFVIAGFSQTDSRTPSQKESSVPHISFTTEALDKLIAGNDPILVDMTASWCITCQVNERIAIYTDATQNLFKEKNVQYVVGDWTNQNPEITAYLNKYERNGVPLYVFYGARDAATGARPEPKILPQLLTSGLIAGFINGEE